MFLSLSVGAVERWSMFTSLRCHVVVFFTGVVRPLELLVPRGVLLTGPPGVGKTFAVRSAVEAVRNVSPSIRGGGESDGGRFQARDRLLARLLAYLHACMLC